MLRRALLLTAALVAVATVPAQAAPTSALPADSGFTPLSPQRVLDTRDGTGVQVVGDHLVLNLQAVLPSSATAVTLNLTGADARQDSYVSAWADGEPVPETSVLNVGSGRTAANLTTVAVPQSRKIDLYMHGDMALIADAAGYYAAGAGAMYTTQTPKRVLDTRTSGSVGPDGVTVLDLSGVLPSTATAAVFNLTATDTTGNTYVTAWPDGGTRPSASNLNLVPGQTRANLVTVAVPTSRKIDLYNHVGTVDLIADLSGYYATDRGDAFYPYSPLRIWDTRRDSMPLGAGDTAILDGKRWFPPALTSMMLNVTATNATTDTYFTPYPADGPRPDASMLNVSPGETVPAMTVVGVSPGDQQAILYNHAGVVDMITDLLGYFAPPSQSCATACPVSWGDNDGGGLGTGAVGGSDARPNQVFGTSGVAAITGSLYTGLALGKDGSVWAWGNNFRGQITDPNKRSYMPLPIRVDLPATTAIAVGDATSYALGSDGLVRAWGAGDRGQTGNADDSESLTPQVIPGLTGVTAIAGGGTAGYAVRSDGTVWGWGDGDLGSATPSSATPQQVAGLSDVVSISATRDTMFALKSDGSVWAWGKNDNAQRGSHWYQPNTAPNQVRNLPAIAKLPSGMSDGTAYALDRDGRVWAWGSCDQGACGTAVVGDPDPKPELTSAPSGTTAIAAGGKFALVLEPDGTVWGWGDDRRNQLGHPVGNTLNIQQLDYLSGVTAIGAGAAQSYAVIG